MAEQSLYDLAPALELMLLGALLAFVPLWWVWRRNRQAGPSKRLQALAMLTLFLTFDLILFGAFTRLTDSGLGCPDWPGCYGNASPIGAHADIRAAQDAMPTGPVTHSKAWIEMIHRYLASGVGVLIIAMTVMAWHLHRRTPLRGVMHPGWATLTLVWVCVQGAFGALTVTMKLFPAIVTLHLLGATALLLLLGTQAVSYQQYTSGQGPAAVSRGLRWALGGSLALVVLQSALGGWVSTNYAVLACDTFPMCQGSWWPSMHFAEGFEIWRPLGLRSDGSHIHFEALTAIHYTHRLVAYIVIAALVALLVRLWREPALTAQRQWLLGALVLQFLTGLSNVVLDWPLVAAVLHTGGAAALALILTWALVATRAAVPVSVSNDEAPSGARSVRA